MAFAYGDELLAELMVAYSTEAAEELQALNENLLALERGGVDVGEAELFREMFRHAHTLKGGAGAVDLRDVKELSHRLESFFALLQSGAVEARAEDFDLLYRTLDAIGILIDGASKSEPVTSVNVPLLSAELDRLTTRARDLPPPVISQDVGDLDQAESERPLEAGVADPTQAADTSAVSIQGLSPGATDDVVRISIGKLDGLMSGMGELIVARNGWGRHLVELEEIANELARLAAPGRRSRRLRRDVSPDVDPGSADPRAASAESSDGLEQVQNDLKQTSGRLAAIVASLVDTTRRSNQITSGLHDDLRGARMLPLQSILGPFPRMIRDLARQQGKEAELQVIGAETELDRAVLEQIKAPLMHLLRNCVDHGLELPAVRTSSGKPAQGTISVAAAQQGENIHIQIADDGRGIDPLSVKQAALAKGILPEEEAQQLNDADVLALVFRAGLSTSTFLTETSGRGVGLDVVRDHVERLGGTIELDTKIGEGTSFSLILPLTVAITRCLLIRAETQHLALPISNVVRIVRPRRGDIRQVDDGWAMDVGGEPISVGDIGIQLGIASERDASFTRPVLVLRAGDRTIALVADEVIGVQDLVVKALPSRLASMENLAGAAILDTGDPVFVLNAADVARTVRAAPSAAPVSSMSKMEDVEQSRSRVILLADDSLTTRTLEKNILQAAGYEVRAVADGAAAWDLVQSEPVDLVVSDVQMPGMDGFELTTRIRADERLRELSVVLVTSLDSPADRRRGIEAGADAYITKSGFDQEHLLDVIRRLL